MIGTQSLMHHRGSDGSYFARVLIAVAIDQISLG